ncbi:kinase-like domain-containing protein [Xylariaceae sp. FL0255]|nr:kinase-like domain-containing protein [Xylariaceae sp. FL0255]
MEQIWEDDKFVPITKLKEIISPEILHRVQAMSPGRVDFNSARIIATLIYIDKLDEHALGSLYKYHLTDRNLPFTFNRERACLDTNQASTSTYGEVGSSNCGTLSFELFHHKVDHDRFERSQWIFMAPSFDSSDTKDYDFDAKCPLPILSRSREPRISSTAKVWKVQIHPGHINHNLPMTEGQNPWLALKEMESDSEKEYFREQHALRKMFEFNHPNLIKVIASFKRGQKYFFLFPWAHGGDLRSFWQNPDNDKQERSPRFMRWILEQICGLASAIRKLYFPQKGKTEENCRHGDIKPKNILLFPDDGLGTLCIADAGLARFHVQITAKRTYGSTTGGGTVEYAPPESRDDDPHVARSRSYDTWSFACVLLEFLVWALGGNSEYAKFEAARRPSRKSREPRFFNINTSRRGEETYTIHPQVEKYINMVESHERCKGRMWIKDLVRVIRKDLLVVDPTKRMPSDKLDDFLEDLLKTAANDKAYLVGNSRHTGFQALPFKKNGFSVMLQK